MAKPMQLQKRNHFKQRLADIADKAVHTALEEATHLANDGSPRSTMDFMRWFYAAFEKRLGPYNIEPRRK